MINQINQQENINSSRMYGTDNQTLLEAHIIDRQDIFYAKGRILAKNVYRDIWNTDNLIDTNHYGVVISHNNCLIGNVNIELRQLEKKLKSETFFGERHWEKFSDVETTEVAEISSLALAQDIPTELRRPVMMMLILGIQSLCRLKGIKFLVTVQHDYLIRILTKSLNLPFVHNNLISKPKGDIPQDDYWKRVKPPRLFYLEPNQLSTIEACSSFLSYLHIIGIQTIFLPRTQVSNISYSKFFQQYC
ncbi:MAG: hypothetical protein QNJ70_17830 [Xenococcaceae cyanobacterium MO_207.B15]|nr:hypothetical protein [Xenococcaceae cyanobacterium MO_207.B15]